MLTQRTSKAQAKGPVSDGKLKDRSLKKAQRKAAKAHRVEVRRRQRMLEKRELRQAVHQGISEYEEYTRWQDLA